MEAEQSKTLLLISTDGIKESISQKAAIRSNYIKMVLDVNPDSIEIPLKIKGSMLKKIKEYLEHYENIEPIEIEKPLPSPNLKECVTEWDYNYIDIDLEEVFQLMLDSNYMGIKSLLELSSAKVAGIIKGKTSEEIKQIFNVQNDFTPEEEQQILEQNNWAFENL